MSEELMRRHAGERRAARLRSGEGWRSAAACQSADPDLFFPVSAAGTSLGQVLTAKAICAGCWVREECLSFAVRTRQAHGVWGGLTEQERSHERAVSRAAG